MKFWTKFKLFHWWKCSLPSAKWQPFCSSLNVSRPHFHVWMSSQNKCVMSQDVERDQQSTCTLVHLIILCCVKLLYNTAIKISKLHCYCVGMTGMFVTAQVIISAICSHYNMVTFLWNTNNRCSVATMLAKYEVHLWVQHLNGICLRVQCMNGMCLRAQCLNRMCLCVQGLNVVCLWVQV